MKKQPPLTENRGYILQEIVVGLVVFAIAMLPLMRGFRMIPQIGAAIGQQSRRETWRSATGEAILQGVDPNQTSMMHLVDQEVPKALMGTIVRRDLPTRAGRLQITVLSALSDNTAEERSVPAGFEIGPGTIPLPPRENPLPPLPAIKLSAPQLNPLSGTMVPILTLAPPSAPGGPYVLSLRAQGADPSNLVKMHTGTPEVHDVSGVGSAIAEINALELAQSVRGRAWAEYAGGASTDVPVSLPDGRTRWLVRDGGRTQVIEPSDPIEFVLGLDLGRPAYSVNGVEYASGTTIPIDFVRAIAIEAGREEAVIMYPAEVRARFGTQWPVVEPSFSWSFGSRPGDSSAGNTVSIYRREGRAVWTSSQTLAATPSGLAGMRPLGGSWTIQRQSIELEPPERVASFYDGDADLIGWLDFTAPLITSLRARMGRPEVNGVESVGDSLSVPIVP